LPIYLQAQDCTPQNCKKYGIALNKGNADLKAKNFKDAVFEYLAAEVASRECGCNAPNIKGKVGEAINGLEQQKIQADENARKAEAAAKRAKAAEKIAKTETAKVKKEQAKATRLKTLIESIDKDNSAYQFLYDEGIEYFEKGDYKNALVYFADAEFLGGEINDSVKVLIDKSKIGISANRNFYAGYLDSSKLEYYEVMNGYVDSVYCFEHIEESNKINKMFYAEIDNRHFDNIENLSLGKKKFKSLPKEIWQLTNLTKLYLHENLLVILPKEIGKLTNLTELILSKNSINSLPKEIGELTNLTELRLGDNSLTELPKEIWQLTNLTELSLYGNPLDSLPKEIGKLTNLMVLMCGGNSLTGLPKEIGQLTNLTELYLGANSLTNLPKEIGQLTNLTELYLRGNSLTGLPKEIGQLTNLTNTYDKPF
jgi:Leucine-rich repeat (LRR) protein